MQTVYTVNGSEDGVIGVFGSVTKAKQCAEMYINRNANDIELQCFSRMRNNGSAHVSMYGDGSFEAAHIEAHIVNFNPLS